MFSGPIRLVPLLLLRCRRVKVPHKCIVLDEQHDHRSDDAGHEAEEQDVHKVHGGESWTQIWQILMSS